jgi:hypothetical protein
VSTPVRDLTPTRGLAIGAGATLVVAVTTAVLLKVYDQSYLANDDVVMAAIASGEFTGTPDVHLVFMGAVPAFLLAVTYRIAPDVAWYGLFLLACQCCCIAVVLVSAWSRTVRFATWQLFAFTLTMLAFVPGFMLRVSFTVTAMLLGLAALVFWTYAGEVRGRPATVLATGGCGSLALAASVRSDSLLAIVVVFSPLLLVLVSRAGVQRPAIVAAATVVLLGAGAVVDHLAYSSPGWRAFAEFNDVRGELHGSARFGAGVSDPNADAIVSALAENGWTDRDIYLFGSWFYDDPGTFSTEKLERIRDAAFGTGTRPKVAEAFRTVTETHRPLVAVVAISALAAAIGGSRRRWLFLGAQNVVALAVFVAVAWRERFPDRIAFPLFFALAVVNTLSIRLFPGPAHATTRDARRLRAIAAAAAVVAAVVTFAALDDLRHYRPADASRWSFGLHTALGDETAALAALDPAGRFVYTGADITIEGANPIAAPGPFDSDQLLVLGWPTFSPAHEVRKQRMGIGADVMSALLVDDHLYLVTTEVVVELVVEAYSRWRSTVVTAAAQLDLGYGRYVFRLQPAAADAG